MRPHQTVPTSIDAYIAAFPPEVQAILEKIRLTIREALPDVEEAISYHMPTFTRKGHALVHIAAYKTHIGLYPAPPENPEFTAALSLYGAGKSTLRFPLATPIPFDLIGSIATFRARENDARAAAKEHL